MLKGIEAELKRIIKGKLFTNFFFLTIAQAGNFVFPLILIPFLTKTVGVDKVGIIYFAQALMAYFIVITDFGFSLTATKEISINRQDTKKIGKTITNVLGTKVLLITFCFILLIAIVTIFSKFSKEKSLYYYSFFVVIGQTFFPTWFFQGMEEMKNIAILNFVSKLFFTSSVFVFIKNPDQYVYVNMIVGMGNIIISIYAFLIIRFKYKINFILFSLAGVKEEIKSGWHIFLSNFSISLYTTSNIFILGLFASPITLGYYSIAEKCYSAVRSVLVIFSQIIYPRACSLASSTHKELKAFYIKIMKPFLAFIILISLLLFFGAPYIVDFFVHNYNEDIIFLLRCFSPILVVVALNIPPYQTTIIFDYKRNYLQVLISASLINIVLNVVLASYYKAAGTVLSIFLTEVFITSGLYISLNRKLKTL